MSIIDAFIGGFFGMIVLTLFLRYSHIFKLGDPNWDILENGAADLFRVSSRQIYIIHLAAEIFIYPSVFFYLWVQGLDLDITGSIIGDALLYALVLALTNALIPILKGPPGSKMKFIVAFFIARSLYGLIIGLFLDLMLVG